MNGMSGSEGKPSPRLTPLGKFVHQFIRLSGAEKAGELVDRVVLSAISHEPLPATRVGEDRQAGILYSDRYSKTMLKKRRRNFWTLLPLSAFLFSIAAMLCVFTLADVLDRPIWDQIWTVFLTAALFLLSFIFADVMLMDERDAMRFGIVLTVDGLSMHGNEIVPNNDILRALVVEFSGDWRKYLAIDIKERKKGKSKVHTALILESDAEDIYQLRDAIREIKKWGGKAQLRPEHFTWKEWKASASELLSIPSLR